jgi:hypothetical protein
MEREQKTPHPRIKVGFAIKKLLNEVRICGGHGQLSPKQKQAD